MNIKKKDLGRISEALKMVIGEKAFEKAGFQRSDLERLFKLSEEKKSPNLEEHIFWENIHTYSPSLIFSRPSL